MRIDVTDHELATIIAALRTVAPTGGGSTAFHLSHTLASSYPDGTTPEFEATCDAMLRNFAQNVLNDYAEALTGRSDTEQLARMLFDQFEADRD